MNNFQDIAGAYRTMPLTHSFEVVICPLFVHNRVN